MPADITERFDDRLLGSNVLPIAAMPLEQRAPPELSYGSQTYWKATANQRAYKRRTDAREELEHSRHTLSAIRKGELVLVQTGAREWWLAQSEESVEEISKEKCALEDIKLKVEWCTVNDLLRFHVVAQIFLLSGGVDVSPWIL